MKRPVTLVAIGLAVGLFLGGVIALTVHRMDPGPRPRPSVASSVRPPATTTITLAPDLTLSLWAYNLIQPGMRLDQVATILGRPGKPLPQQDPYAISYSWDEGSQGDALIVVTFTRGVAVRKIQLGLDGR